MAGEEVQKIRVYTDGSCSPNPGRGGWAAVLVREDETQETIQGGEEETTNNRMELTAALKAMQHVKVSSELSIYTDSKYLRDGITEWLPRWRDRGWFTAFGEPVANQDLWQQLSAELERHTVEWSWVKGHAGDELNNLADRLAASVRQKPVLPLADHEAVHIFLAITWRQKEGAGAWAAILRYREKYKIIGGVQEEGTGNSLHISSAVAALKQLKRLVPVHLYTTSGYLRDGATHWLSQWRQRDWLTREGLEVSNREVWQELAGVLSYLPAQLHQVDKQEAPCHILEAKEIAKEFFADREN